MALEPLCCLRVLRCLRWWCDSTDASTHLQFISRLGIKLEKIRFASSSVSLEPTSYQMPGTRQT